MIGMALLIWGRLKVACLVCGIPRSLQEELLPGLQKLGSIHLLTHRTIIPPLLSRNGDYGKTLLPPLMADDLCIPQLTALEARETVTMVQQGIHTCA